MAGNNGFDIDELVEPDRVHRACYADEDIFEREIRYIFNKSWIYVGHESQIPKSGDYATTVIGRQPVIMVRHQDRSIHVLYNRCPHRGTLLCNQKSGNTGGVFTCSYHSWQFKLDGKVRHIPIQGGYDNTRFSLDDPNFHMKPVARMEIYRGFIFSSLSTDGPGLKSWLGNAIAGIDDMCNRAPEGEVEVVPTCFRMIQKSNWKIFLENQLDSVHPSITHSSTGLAAQKVEKEMEAETGRTPPLSYHYISAFAMELEKWGALDVVGHPNGHCVLQGYMGLRPNDPDTLEYEEVMRKNYGPDRTEEILDVNIHHLLVYPCLSIQSPLQQLRAVRPLASNKTLTEIWHFRLKGAPEAIYRRSLDYFYLVNSPSTMINADDLYNFWKCQVGLESDGGDWVSFHRNAGQDLVDDGVATSVIGFSELPMRNQFEAWRAYMTAEERT